jgi:predicted dithiol-disulfide oxidoreductase (DUF899 family)
MPAPETTQGARPSFPGESGEYRAARDRLLAAEIELRRSIERVAAERRALPPGGAVPEDYVFEEAGGEVRLSEVFEPVKDTLAVYSFMYGPEDDRPCPACTSILDSLDGSALHITQRINLAVVAKSPFERIRAFADERGWHRLRLLSSAGNPYNRDYLGETPDGDQMPMLNVFTRDGDTIRHFWGCELLYAPTEPGQHERHVDFIWPLWGLLDTTPDGRGDWGPSLSYGARGASSAPPKQRSRPTGSSRSSASR